MPQFQTLQKTRTNATDRWHCTICASMNLHIKAKTHYIFIMKSYSEYKQPKKKYTKKKTHNLGSRNTLNENSHIRCCKKVELLNVKQLSRMNTNSSNIRALLSSSESINESEMSWPMIVIAIGLMCLLQLQKEQLDKKRKITVLKNSFKKRVLFCCFKTKETCLKKKTFVLKQAHISSTEGPPSPSGVQGWSFGGGCRSEALRSQIYTNSLQLSNAFVRSTVI